MLSRQLGMVYLLMKRKSVTAGELAERYEVSVRTIYRDVEALSMAGIPIYTRKGKNGGISLTEEFVLNKLLVTEKEQQQILAALQSLEEVGVQDRTGILQKLGDFFKVEPRNWVAIDFSDWSGRRKDLFKEIRRAILENRVMVFDYYGQYGEMTHRTVEPLQLVFKDFTWYLRAFCRDRQAMRLFKVLRMKRTEVMDETFQSKEILQESCGDVLQISDEKKQKYFPVPVVTVRLHIEASEAYRVYDRFEEDEITVLPQGDFIINMKYPLDDWVYGMILSFGPSAEILEPETVREEVRRRLQVMLEKYEK